jgi:hypothetical protein
LLAFSACPVLAGHRIKQGKTTVVRLSQGAFIQPPSNNYPLHWIAILSKLRKPGWKEGSGR